MKTEQKTLNIYITYIDKEAQNLIIRVHRTEGKRIQKKKDRSELYLEPTKKNIKQSKKQRKHNFLHCCHISIFFIIVLRLCAEQRRARISHQQQGEKLRNSSTIIGHFSPRRNIFTCRFSSPFREEENNNNEAFTNSRFG